jgi:multidrug resistance efflux pump
VELATATLDAARKNLENPVHLEAALAEAEAALAKVTTEAKNLPFAEQAAEARLQIAQQELEGKQRLDDVVAARAVQRAQSEFDSATAAVNELRERRTSLQSEIESCERKCAALRRQLELKAEEHRKVNEAQAGFKIAEARRDQAQLAVEGAELRLERMVIQSPIDGRVLALHAQPGQRLVGLSPSSEKDASAVVSLYDPQSLQIRADVRLEYLAQTEIGQAAEITTAALQAPLRGEVIAITSQADVQKNTLQVKVAIHDPPPLIKPEMLAQVTFLAPQHSGQKSESDSLRKLIPRQLVQGGKDSPSVWVADLSKKRARLQPIQLGRAQAGELIEVEKGLSTTNKLIVGGREGLRDGERIRVVGEDRRLGTQAPSEVSPIAANDTAARR